jgi:hypothetical protein
MFALPPRGRGVATWPGGVAIAYGSPARVRRTLHAFGRIRILAHVRASPPEIEHNMVDAALPLS